MSPLLFIITLKKAPWVINGKTHYLFRAMDQDGCEQDVLVTECRGAKAAMRFFKMVKALEQWEQVTPAQNLELVA